MLEPDQGWRLLASSLLVSPTDLIPWHSPLQAEKLRHSYISHDRYDRHMSIDGPPPDAIVKFVGVYDADGTIVGEVKYMVGKLFGTTSCALCDLTHGTKLKGRDDYRACAASLPVPVELFHRNDQPETIRALTIGKLPCIIAVYQSGSHALAIEREALEACSKDVNKLRALILALL